MQSIYYLTGEATQAKAAPRTPAEPNTTQQPGNDNTFTPDQGTGLMALFSQYWYIPASLAAVLVFIGVTKRKR